MEAADLLILDANVFTADARRPRAQALGIRGNRIIFVGDNAGAKRWTSPKSRVIEARGRSVLPGFIDSHLHLLMGAEELGFAQLQDVRSMDELSAALRSHADKNPQAEWVLGTGLVYGIKPASLPPTRHDLDAILPERPTLLISYDGHTGWVNTEALRRAELLHGRELAAPSEVVLGADGLATGELREAAGELVFELVPKNSPAEKRALLLRAMQQAAAFGLTSVHNMDGDMEQIEFYAALEREGQLLVRVYVPLTVQSEMEVSALQEAVAMREKFSAGMVRGGLTKFFMDGVFESYTGFLLDDYEGRPGVRGIPNFEMEHFTELALEADRLGLQIAVHCTGDAAVRRVLDTYELVRKQNGRRDERHRIEHIELVSDDDLPRFAELDVTASMQPAHRPLSASGSDFWPARVGPGRWRRSFAWRALRDAGARLAFGSDWSVASLNPMTGIRAALSDPFWQAETPVQRQTLEEVLLSYTRDGAHAEFMEHEKGILKGGYLADVVMLSEDIFQVPPEELLRVKADLTICDGRITHES
jgi:predicted amidohydrolase YtcJ